MMGFDSGFGMMGGLGWPGMAATLLFWIGVIVLVVWTVSAASRRRGQPADAALDLLRQRYARGEIDRAAFEEARKVLA